MIVRQTVFQYDMSLSLLLYVQTSVCRVPSAHRRSWLYILSKGITQRREHSLHQGIMISTSQKERFLHLKKNSSYITRSYKISPQSDCGWRLPARQAVWPVASVHLVESPACFDQVDIVEPIPVQSRCFLTWRLVLVTDTYGHWFNRGNHTPTLVKENNVLIRMPIWIERGTSSSLEAGPAWNSHVSQSTKIVLTLRHFPFTDTSIAKRRHRSHSRWRDIFWREASLESGFKN